MKQNPLAELGFTPLAKPATSTTPAASKHTTGKPTFIIRIHRFAPSPLPPILDWMRGDSEAVAALLAYSLTSSLKVTVRRWPRPPSPSFFSPLPTNDDAREGSSFFVSPTPRTQRPVVTIDTPSSVRRALRVWCLRSTTCVKRTTTALARRTATTKRGTSAGTRCSA